MVIYLVFFCIICILTYIAEFFLKKKNNKILFWIFMGIVIFLISAFAGVRDKTVGTDVTVYAEPIFESIDKYGLNFTLRYSNVEKLYVYLTYFIWEINGNLNTVLFGVQMLISIPLGIYLYHNRNQVSITISILIYMFVFYGLNFNLMRQSIAMAIVLFGIRYVAKRDFIKYFVCIILAMNFHLTAVTMLPVYFIYPLFLKKEKNIYQIIILSIVVLIVVTLKNVLGILLGYGLIPEKFSSYLNQFLINGVDFQLIASIFKIGFFVLIFLYNKFSRDSNEHEKSFMFFLAVIDLIIFQCGALISYAERISYYFSIITYMFFLPRLVNIVKKNKFNKITIRMIILAYIGIYWYVTFVILRVSCIIPYTSQIINI